MSTLLALCYVKLEVTMTYYEPHPAHVLAGDAFFESRVKIIRKLFVEDDYCKRWDLARELVGKYTSREFYVLVNKWEIEVNSSDQEPDLMAMYADLTDFIAHNYVPERVGNSRWIIEDVLANPASRLPTSDVWGTE
jgi:hypothetical protein|tara:strand:- start:664 stop:1071 length:408 start_codon:yes stop_codon:yes gene_type:complete